MPTFINSAILLFSIASCHAYSRYSEAENTNYVHIVQRLQTPTPVTKIRKSSSTRSPEHPTTSDPTTALIHIDCVVEVGFEEFELPGCGCCGPCGCDEECDTCHLPLPSDTHVNDTCHREDNCCPGKLRLTTLFVPDGCPAPVVPSPQRMVLYQRGWDDIDVEVMALATPLHYGGYSVRFGEVPDATTSGSDDEDTTVTTTAPALTTTTAPALTTTAPALTTTNTSEPTTTPSYPDCVVQTGFVEFELPGCGCCGPCGCDEECDTCGLPLPSDTHVNDTCHREDDCCPGKLRLTTLFVPDDCPAEFESGPQTLVLDQRGWDDVDVTVGALVTPLSDGEYSVRLQLDGINLHTTSV